MHIEPEKPHEMRILGRIGDTKISWNTQSPSTYVSTYYWDDLFAGTSLGYTDVSPNQRVGNIIIRHQERSSETITVKAKPDPNCEIYAERAKNLLLEHLNENNKKKFHNKEPIEIPSKIFSDIIYNIPLSKVGKIGALKENKIVDRLCLLVKEPEFLPLEDVILTKMLHILYNEEDMLRTAHHYPENENLLTRIN